jgi:hypothetical protein
VNSFAFMPFTPSPRRAIGASAKVRTHYGRAPASPHTHMQHHFKRLSRAAVMGDAASGRHLHVGRLSPISAQQVCLLPRIAFRRLHQSRTSNHPGAKAPCDITAALL